MMNEEKDNVSTLAYLLQLFSTLVLIALVFLPLIVAS